VGRQKLFHQQILNSSPLQMQIQSGSLTPQICGACGRQAPRGKRLRTCVQLLPVFERMRLPWAVC